MRLARLVGTVAITLAVGCGGGKHAVDDACATNSDCADNICHDGICASSHPLAAGGSCHGDGECRSFNCAAGTCAPGTSLPGVSCLYPDECAAATCSGGVCGGAPGADGGLLADSGSHQVDAPASCPTTCGPGEEPCLCSATCGGHTYGISCMSALEQCTCTIDGATTKTITGGYGPSCVSTDSILARSWADCGFPAMSAD